MRRVVLACGPVEPQPFGDEVDVVRVSERPGKKDVDPLLGDDAQRLIVIGTDADLAAVALRLLRKDRLAGTELAFLPTEKRSAVARLWDLPTKADRAWTLAHDGTARSVPLIRDDAGGVLLAHGVIAPIRAVAYCDDQLALREPARALAVRPSEPEGDGLVVRITARGSLRRRRTYHGRALQLSFDPNAPATPILDGIARSRSTERWTWYRHTEDLRLVRP